MSGRLTRMLQATPLVTGYVTVCAKYEALPRLAGTLRDTAGPNVTWELFRIWCAPLALNKSAPRLGTPGEYHVFPLRLVP